MDGGVEITMAGGLSPPHQTRHFQLRIRLSSILGEDNTALPETIGVLVPLVLLGLINPLQ